MTQLDERRSDFSVVGGETNLIDHAIASTMAEAASQIDLQTPSDREFTQPVRVRLDEHTEILVGLSRAQSALKRAFDLAVTIPALVLVIPLFALLYLAVKVTSAGPALFRQERVGTNGDHFYLLKFRTMVEGAEDLLQRDETLRESYLNGGYKISDDADPRVTPVGRFLRKTSLDELPQLINVLKGEMSLVGPRPVVPLELEEYRELKAIYMVSKPGVTGFWQLNGRDRVGFPERGLMELMALCNWSLLRDLRIVLLTLPAVLVRAFGGSSASRRSL